MKRNFPIILLCLFFSGLHAQTTRYVKPVSSGTGDGSSWADASSDLQSLIDASTANDEIWVAAGIYKPFKNPVTGSTANPNDRDNTFLLKDGVKIYGGFTGIETALSQRNWQTNTTILSGDIGTPNNSSDNCYHVVLSVSDGATTLLDGMTITAGKADGTGAIDVEGSGTNITRKDGGGFQDFTSSVSITNCTFAANNATGFGGGLYNNNSFSVFSNCFFSGNTANSGGALYSYQGSVTFTKCIFSNNTATKGGGVYNFNSATLTGCVFAGNIAASVGNSTGGAIANDVSSKPITNCVFTGNSSDSASCINNFISSPVITNCTFSGNSSANNIIIGNTVFSFPEIRNSVIWGGEAVYNSPNSDITISYTDIQGGYTGTGNINANPLFADASDPDGPDNSWGTEDDGLKLQCSSPALDAGSNALVPGGITSDITGAVRIQNGTVDMGAYEGTASASYVLATVNSSDTRVQAGTVTYGNCSNLIATVSSTGANPISGTTTAKVWIEAAQPNQFVKRHYEITPAANASTSTGRIKLYFNQAEFDAFNAVNTVKLPTGPADAAGKANLLVEKRPGISSDGTGLPGTYTGGVITIDPVDADIVWNSTYSRWEISIDVAGFSGFFVKVISDIPLPVKWLEVSASLDARQYASIRWQVQEYFVSHYEIEKSSDGISFVTIGRVNSNGDGQNLYRFTDDQVLQGTAYYRIRQTDNDGRVTYSNILKLSAGSAERLYAFPSPFKDGFTVQTNKTQTALLLDTKGSLIKRVQLTAGSNYIPCNNLVPGVYLLRSADGEVQKLIKQ